MRRLLSAAAVAVILGSGNAQAAIVNGGFETGDFTGWTEAISTGSFEVTSSFAGITDYSAVEGNQFAVLWSADTGFGDGGNYNYLRQEFTVAQAGMQLVGWAAFNTFDYFDLPWNDDAYVKVSSVSDATTLFYSSAELVGAAFENNGGGTPWTAFSYIFSAPGTYLFEAAVRNLGDDAVSSQLLLDNVAVVPIPGALMLMLSALAGIGGFGWFGRRKGAEA